MAFPVPDHLPKRSTPVDVSSKILYKIDSATKDTLNSALASSWIRELDDSILETEVGNTQRIHDRIQSNLPKFQHQLEASKSVQARFEALTSTVEELGNSLSNPKNGLVPTLLSTLEKHSALAQEASDATTVYQAWSYLVDCKTAYSSVLSLVQLGKLPEAVGASVETQQLVDGIPEYLKQTNAAMDLKQKFNATKAKTQDQLSNAFLRGIIVSPTEITVHPTIQVRQSDTVLDLSSVLRSLEPSSLSNHLATLRRDLMAHFVDHVLKQPYNVTVKSSLGNEVQLSLIPAPPNTEDLRTRLDNVSTILEFLSSNLFPHVPPQERTQFMRTLSKPVMTSVLSNLLMPSLPGSFGLLSSYLDLLKRAVVFEERDIGSLLESDMKEGSIKAWSDGVSGHYERRRRVEILELARKEVLFSEDNETFEAYTEGGPETSLPSVVPVQPDEDFREDAWGFDEPITANPVAEPADGWGLDDDMEVDPVPEAPNEDDEEIDPNTPVDSKFVADEAQNLEPDPADAWGWNEDDDLPTDEVPEDNPWDDPWEDSAPEDPVPEPQPQPLTSPAPVRAATKLEKLASKNKKHLNGNSHSPLSSPPIPDTPPQTITFTPPSPKLEPSPKALTKAGRLNGAKRPADVMTTIMSKELYKVPKKTKRILKMVETAIDESKLFYASNLFPSSQDSASTPGAILVQSASSIVELYLALYPVKFSKELESAERGMLFSNSCLYMTGSIQRIEDTIYGQPALKERLTECRERLQILGHSWFDDTVERQQLRINQILLDGAQGFMYTGDQDRYDECEAAVNEALKHIKRLAQNLKGILTKNKYYSAIGAVVDTALLRVLQDVLALSDIPEVESHRISELCRILTALEGLFSEHPEQPSFVVAFVPNWLKFSYLSELLEASLADITYLFEQGALVDFQVNELVNLVRSLFADTVLRTNTINKILGGHPVQSH
ncbi:hypothetical protein CVT25_010308 [Psilocybe cyanescens]|uniref:ZW10 C-terminal helical domain-containing protein n=1 Tax=Psilocybe cyanescens TaxID=93625 RepID=A0A409VNR4_PSICY|nr:hypothetical protein CVT25_010308 [Psilocybe cyanescens]